jgi:hypothetical protein
MDAATIDRTRVRQPLRLAAGGLEVVFEWAGDRWGHRFVHRGRLVAESVEGVGASGDPRWPRSPALQEVSTGGTADRPVLLAVGAAGRSHFSASVAADPARPDTVLVEVACRVHEPAAWLGSTYRLEAGGTVRILAEPTGHRPCTLRWSCRVGPEGVSPAGVAAEGGPGGPA